MLQEQGVPKCSKCGGDIKPDVVLYEEGLDNGTLRDAIDYIQNADVLIIGGTSLVVYPAAGLREQAGVGEQDAYSQGRRGGSGGAGEHRRDICRSVGSGQDCDAALDAA